MTSSRQRICLCVALVVALAPACAGAMDLSGPLVDLQTRLSTAAMHAPGRVGIEVEDLATGMTSGTTVVHLESRDRDWGWGDLADARPGIGKTVKQLLWLMITRSDNTATNMLIRKVGRTHINQTMDDLGVPSTHLGDYIRSESDAIRYALRTSPHDMLELLDAIARDKMIDTWSSREMLSILAGQTHNSLLPVPLLPLVPVVLLAPTRQ